MVRWWTGAMSEREPALKPPHSLDAAAFVYGAVAGL